MFRTVPLSIIRRFSLYTQQWYMSYRFSDKMVYVIQVTVTACEQEQDGTAVPSCSCSQAVSKPVWHILLLCVQWKTHDDGQRNCPKRVVFYSKNKFEKLVQLVGLLQEYSHNVVILFKKVRSIFSTYGFYISIFLTKFICSLIMVR